MSTKTPETVLDMTYEGVLELPAHPHALFSDPTPSTGRAPSDPARIEARAFIVPYWLVERVCIAFGLWTCVLEPERPQVTARFDVYSCA
jgi:hypothetical protein